MNLRAQKTYRVPRDMFVRVKETRTVSQGFLSCLGHGVQV